MTSSRQPQRILLVDGDSVLRCELASYFLTQGFRVTEAEGAHAMARVLSTMPVDLVIAEPDLPDLGGHVLLNLLREANGACVIILTRNLEEVDRIIALELGADDYLVKPVSQRELLARARAVLRRATSPEHQGAVAARSRLPDGGIMIFDRIQRRVTMPDGATLELTTAEFNLLDVLSDHVDKSLTREKLYEDVFHRRWSALDRTLDTLVAKLRRKLEREPRHPELIKTVHGVGYVFTSENFRKVSRT